MTAGSKVYAGSVIDFESGSGNVSPSNPYTEFGYTFTPLNSDSDIQSGVMFGDSTNALAFQGADGDAPRFLNTITMTGPAPFDVTTVMIGRFVLAPSIYPTTDMTITGGFTNGSSQSITFSGITDAETFSLDWNNLTSLVFSPSVDAAIDNIDVTPASTSNVPEPSSVAFVIAGGMALLAIRRRYAK